MSDLDTRLADELLRMANHFGLAIYMDDIKLMPRPWQEQLVACLEGRVELWGRLNVRYRNYKSVEEFSKDVDLTRTLDAELHGLLLEVADARPTRN